MNLSPLNGIIPNWGAETLQNFDTNNIQDGERLRGSNRQYVRFYKKKDFEIHADKVKINEKTGDTRVISTKAVEVEKEMVHVVTPGDKNVYDGEAQDFHKREFWRQYSAYRSGQTAPLGSSVDDANFISPQIATELKYHGCHTVEQLAEASDILCGNLPNGWELREFARQYCKVQNENKSLGQVNVLKAELESTKAMLASLQEQMKGIVDSSGRPIKSGKSKKEKTEDEIN